MTATILPLHPRQSDKPCASLQGKIECYQKIMRDWSQHLDPFEMTTLFQIVDRTIGWGRVEAYFTTRAMLKGDSIYSGMKMGRTKLFEALASLEDRGFIRRRPDPHVRDRIHYSVNMHWTPEASINLPKRLRNGTQTPSATRITPARNTDHPVRHADAIDSNPLQVSETGILPAPSSPGSFNPVEKIRETETKAKIRHRSTLARKAASAQAIVAQAEATWRLALIDTFPGTAARTWTIRDQSQVKMAHRNWGGDITLVQLIDWSVRNWTAIMHKQFKWMRKDPPPVVPSLSFFMAMLTQFAECRAESKLEDWLSDKDRTEIERLEARGITYEQAISQIAKTKAAAALRGEMEKREIHVRARERSAEFKEKRAQQLADLEGRVPIHPRSKLAEEMRRAEVKKPTLIYAPDDPEFSSAGLPMVDATRNPFDD